MSLLASRRVRVRALHSGGVMRKLVRLVLLLACFIGAAAGVAHAQNIVGTVRDDSGAVMPGVTVEAASPALLEKVRTVITDGAGQVLDPEPEPRHLHRHVQPARLQHRPSRGHRPEHRVHGDGRWVAEGRVAGRDDHRVRRLADRGPRCGRPIDGADTRNHGRPADGAQHPGADGADARRDIVGLGGRRPRRWRQYEAAAALANLSRRQLVPDVRWLLAAQSPGLRHRRRHQFLHEQPRDGGSEPRDRCRQHRVTFQRIGGEQHPERWRQRVPWCGVRGHQHAIV